MLSYNFPVPKEVAGFMVHNVSPVRGGDSYLFVNDEVTFIFDSGFGFSAHKLYENIKAVLGERPLDYVLLTHSHYDHCLGSSYIRKMYPEVKVVAFSYAAKIMGKEGARNTMLRLDKAAQELHGFDRSCDSIDYLMADMEVNDGDEFMLGKDKVTIISLPGHTKDSVAYYFADKKLMLGCETIGMYVDEDTVMPSFLVGYNMTLDSIKKVMSMDIDYYMIPHWGLLEGLGVKTFFDCSYKSHIDGNKLIVDAYKEGKTIEEIIPVFEQKYMSDDVRVVYPPAAFLENVNIQIPLILKEEGLLN